MPEENRNVKIRVKSGESEVEVEAPLTDIREAIELIPDVLAKLPAASMESRAAPVTSPAQATAPQGSEPAHAAVHPSSVPSSVPTVTVEKGDSLSDVILKFFSDSWGRNPRKLMEVREALQSYGLNYPKQSVAVALLRLAKASRIRRFKGEGGEYVYTVSTGTVRILAPEQPVIAQQAVEEQAAPALVAGEEQEEQLDLDAPSAN